MKRRYLIILIAVAVGTGGTGALTAWQALAAGGTVLCKTAEAPCAAANHYPKETNVWNHATLGMITTNLGHIICVGWPIVGKTSSTGGSSESVSYTIESIVPVGCAIQTPFKEHACKVTALNAPYKGTISRTEGTAGTLTIESGGKGEYKLKVDCGASLLRCEFGFGTPVLDVFSGSWDFFANRESLTTTVYEGGTCPKEASWWAHFNQKPVPSTMYLEEGA